MPLLRLAFGSRNDGRAHHYRRYNRDRDEDTANEHRGYEWKRRYDVLGYACDVDVPPDIRGGQRHHVWFSICGDGGRLDGFRYGSLCGERISRE